MAHTTTSLSPPGISVLNFTLIYNLGEAITFPLQTNNQVQRIRDQMYGPAVLNSILKKIKVQKCPILHYLEISSDFHTLFIKKYCQNYPDHFSEFPLQVYATIMNFSFNFGETSKHFLIYFKWYHRQKLKLSKIHLFNLFSILALN